MDNEITQEILNRIDSLGELSQQGFEVLVRQAYITGISQLLAGLLLLTLSVGLAIAAWRSVNEAFLAKRIDYQERSTYRWATGDTLALWLGSAALTIVLPGVVNVWHGVKWLINPEFYAIRYLLHAL